MRHHINSFALCALALTALLLSSCVPAFTPTFPPTLLPTIAPSPSPTPTPTPSPTPSPTPTPTSTPTPAPTLDPATVTGIVGKVEARLVQAGIEPLCLRWEDADDDGTAEWVGLYHRPGEGGKGELMAFILDDDETWYELRPLKKEPGKKDFGLGQYPTCELEVRDVNADGHTEVLIWGHAETSTALLHIFVWKGDSYVLLASFEGDAGIRQENRDGDLADEFAVRYDAGSGLVWEAVHTWDGLNYGWTWERYDWFYLSRPHPYPTDTPEHAVISFYLALDDRDIPGAYNLLTQGAQAVQTYQVWAAGFATTVAVEVGSVHELARQGNTATVAAQVRALDNVDGRIIATLWDVEWQLQETEYGWRLDSASASQLERWELKYYR